MNVQTHTWDAKVVGGGLNDADYIIQAMTLSCADIEYLRFSLIGTRFYKCICNILNVYIVAA